MGRLIDNKVGDDDLSVKAAKEFLRKRREFNRVRRIVNAALKNHKKNSIDEAQKTQLRTQMKKDNILESVAILRGLFQKGHALDLGIPMESEVSSNVKIIGTSAKEAKDDPVASMFSLKPRHVPQEVNDKLGNTDLLNNIDNVLNVGDTANCFKLGKNKNASLGF
jgi:hypothetical protein